MHRIVAALLALTACGKGAEHSEHTDNRSAADALDAVAVETDAAHDAIDGAFELSVAACGTLKINTGRELLIRDTAIVDAPLGAWNFGTLMTNMTPIAATATAPTPAQVDAFIRHFLAEWAASQPVNGIAVPARPAISEFIRAWPKNAAGQLDVNRAPFRLLAIVNRMDLRSAALPGTAGEGRLVFEALTPIPSKPVAQWASQPVTVIFEYHLPIVKNAAGVMQDVNWWAAQWHAVAAPGLTPAQVKARLGAVTNAFTARRAWVGRVNHNAIAQVRTNEIQLGSPWELREFTLAASGQLEQTTVKQTPDFSFNSVPAKLAKLKAWMVLNKAALLAGNHKLPAKLADGTPFLGGAAPVPDPSFTWLANQNTPPAGVVAADWNRMRHNLSANTCSGCHAGDNAPGGNAFLQLSQRETGQASEPAPFLVGDLVKRAAGLKAVLCPAP